MTRSHFPTDDDETSDKDSSTTSAGNAEGAEDGSAVVEQETSDGPEVASVDDSDDSEWEPVQELESAPFVDEDVADSGEDEAPADSKEEPDVDTHDRDKVTAESVASSENGHPEDSCEDPYAAEGDEDVEDEGRSIIVEHLAPALSRRATLTAAAVAAGVSLLVGIMPSVFSSNAEPVGVSSVAVEPGIHNEDTSASSSVQEAMQSVFRIDSGNQSGSSYLVDDNMLATNAHVATADVGEEVNVTSPGGETFKGEVVMRDEYVDIALVKVPEQEASPLPLVSVKEQEVGQDVYLAGYPINLGLTLTTGVASAVDARTDLNESAGQHSLLQIDAAVNPGSSGGPVLDRSGRVMGMATSRPDSVGGRDVQGIAFAVPANDVSIAIQQYNDHGDVAYGRLGAAFSGDSNRLRHVTPNSPAADAGLEGGDAFVKINGYNTPGYTEASRHLHLYRPGEQVTLTVERDGETRDIDVVLEERE